MGGDGFYASLEDPRYIPSVLQSAPNTDPADLRQPSPARTGRIWGSLYRSPTNYTLFTGGLAQLWEDGTTEHGLAVMTVPYSYVGTRPTEAWEAGFKSWRPKLSAFVNRALGAANAGRTPATRIEGPNEPERALAIPRTAFFGKLPKNEMTPYTKHLGYVTRWPSAPMTFQEMGGNA